MSVEGSYVVSVPGKPVKLISRWMVIKKPVVHIELLAFACPLVLAVRMLSLGVASSRCGVFHSIEGHDIVPGGIRAGLHKLPCRISSACF